MPGVGSWLVHMDDDRRPVDDDELLAEGVTLGGYPALAARELPNPDEPLDGADAGGGSVDDDGVLHTESRDFESLVV